MVEDSRIFSIINSSLTQVSSKSKTEHLPKGSCRNELESNRGFACVALTFGQIFTGLYFKPCQYDKTLKKCPLGEYKPNKNIFG